MKTIEELLAAAREVIAAGDDDKASDIICEALGHLPDFSRGAGEVWDRDTVRVCCHEIGELIFDQDGIGRMQDVHRLVYAKMKGVAARYLEHFWNGCGDGEWRS